MVCKKAIERKIKMKNLLVGNGINIRFDLNYTTTNIILRLLTDTEQQDYPTEYIVDDPLMLKCYIGKLFLCAREIINGEYDRYAFGTAEIKALEDFKERYKPSIKELRIADIGFEDYYLIHDLVCHKHKVFNPDKYVLREMMKMAYFHAIYNRGKLNELHKQYSDRFIKYLLQFDNIFTTNYDKNIELATGKEVYHIHGQFDKYSEVYNPESFRNQLDDNPLKDVHNDIEFMYLHSTALSTHCGDYKEFQIKQSSLANSAVEKMAKGYLEHEAIRKDIDSWKNVSNQLVVNLANSIKLKVENPNQGFQEDYSVGELKKINGTIEILGLSPYNDYHIFENIDNSNINKCIYYYFNKSECERIKRLLTNFEGVLEFKNVEEFWTVMK